MRKWYSLLVLVVLLGSPHASFAVPLTYEVFGTFDDVGDPLPLSGQSFSILFMYNTDEDKIRQQSNVTVRRPNTLAFQAPGTIEVEDGYILHVYTENLSEELRVEFHMIFGVALAKTFTLNDPLPLDKQEHGDVFVWQRQGEMIGSAHLNQPTLQAIPEPGTVFLLASGILWLGWHWRRQMKTRKE